MANIGPIAAEIGPVYYSLRHPCKFPRVLRLGSVTARHFSSGRQPNFAVLNRAFVTYGLFGRATITLGIGPHSSLLLFSSP